MSQEPARVTLTPTVWITGLSSSGKSTLAEGLAALIQSAGSTAEIIDGADIRTLLGGFFGYSREERMKVSRVLCTIARPLARNRIVPIVTAITPYQESRDFNRRELAPYLELFTDCPLEKCIERDVDDRYRRALNGDLKHFIGVDDPFEFPRNYDLRLATSEETVEESVSRAWEFLKPQLQLG